MSKGRRLALATISGLTCLVIGFADEIVDGSLAAIGVSTIAMALSALAHAILHEPAEESAIVQLRLRSLVEEHERPKV